MNVARGLWRAWIFVTVLWVIGTVAVAYNSLPYDVARKYQYIEELKKGSGKPWEIDWSKGYYDLMRSPSKELITPAFDALSYVYVADWEEHVKAGKLISVDFPDKSRLYLSIGMNKDDKDYLGKAFWDQRWQRYGQEVLPYLYAGAGPPIVLLLIGSFLVWVGRGFARDEPRLG